ncbi:hypothetical protein [Marinobacter sp. F3R08]|uniref:hypothetical protein n=1 Tax=Marinobacter sp. F3R08 TaxID=2841559 RepID=UPI001C08C935|nr:hypothetical protein [Marinobacter sp. F3R08]MBU2952246.1 hypothetical protein [Marinobacter sp. F3R08]
MSISISLFSLFGIKEQRTVAIAVTAQSDVKQPAHLSACEDSTHLEDRAVLEYLKSSEHGWNKGLDVLIYVSGETLDSPKKFENWLVDVKKTQALTTSQLTVMVQSSADIEWFKRSSDQLEELRQNQVKIGLDVRGDMEDAKCWRRRFPWDLVQLDLGKCRSDFSQFAVYTAGLHRDGIGSFITDVHDRSELITIEQLYAGMAVGPVYGKTGCLWSGPLS